MAIFSYLATSFGYFLPLASSWASTLYFLQHTNHIALEVSVLASNLLLGVNIFLLAQIFHISAYYPDGILWWIIGMIPGSLLLKSVIQTMIIQSVALIWLV
ncbi:MAG: DUF2157 domain-containing protein, partial [Bacteroidia bacterium]|nr:DUF2157 domain-containing protein [Bacteroidia bacterium]